MHIYIPIWLDLLCVILIQKNIENCNLHSNMVRFIIKPPYIPPMQSLGNLHSNMVRFIIEGVNKMYVCNNCIYIPIWLDLLYIAYIVAYTHKKNLHSNMVRFIMSSFTFKKSLFIKFTFQYGQIYYARFTSAIIV